MTLADHGIVLEQGQLQITCSRTPCLTPGATVQVSYRTAVQLPLLPDGFGLATFPISATHTQVVDVYSEVRP
jgi:hypothetical protein